MKATPSPLSPSPLQCANDDAFASFVAASLHTHPPELIREMQGVATPSNVRFSVNRLAARRRVSVTAYAGGVLVQRAGP